MPKHLAELREQILHELGTDVYRAYREEEGRHQIPDELVVAVATACIVEYMKGFVDFKTLGEGTRAWLKKLWSRLRTRTQLDYQVDTLELEKLSAAAKDGIRHRPPSAQTLRDAEAGLAIALSELGLDRKDAEDRARKIAPLTQAYLQSR